MEDSRTEFSNAINKAYGEKGQETVTASIDHIQKKVSFIGISVSVTRRLGHQ